jgi:hypothetical protein
MSKVSSAKNSRAARAVSHTHTHASLQREGDVFPQFGPSLMDRAAILSTEAAPLTADQRKRLEAYAGAVSSVTKNLEARNKYRQAMLMREIGDPTHAVSTPGADATPYLPSPTLGVVLGFVGARTLLGLRAAKRARKSDVAAS